MYLNHASPLLIQKWLRLSQLLNFHYVLYCCFLEFPHVQKEKLFNVFVNLVHLISLEF